MRPTSWLPTPIEMAEPVGISINLVGDYWYNQQEIEEKLSHLDAVQPIVFDTGHEGGSLNFCGFIDFLNSWVKLTGRDPGTITIDTPNQFEQLPYRFARPRPASHFFYRPILHYHRDMMPIPAHAKLFGLFVGRYTPIRNQMVKEMLELQEHFLFSVMTNDQTDLSNPSTVTYDPMVWNIGSIDNTKLSHRRGGMHTPDTSLLEFYDQFQIEIVPESTTLGQTFFPTEKTVRPIMGCKPILLCGARKFLHNLRNLGFRTFGSLWSESYDDLEDQDRWQAIKHIIMDIIRDGYDRDAAQKIVQYNYQHLQDNFVSKHG